MLGTFQACSLRIEVPVATAQIRASLLQPRQFSRWLWPQQISTGLPDELQPNTVFTSYLGPIEIRHEVKQVSEVSLHILMAGGIDGFHEWYWGDHWVQAKLEGISALPLSLGQSLVMLRLKSFLS